MALNINGTTGISGVDGSVSAPVLTGTDSNCGISFPSADTIKFSTGGVERMSITNSGISGITAGITMADQWRVTSPYTNSGTNDITANWERVDSTAFGQLGTGMSESSGVFTFPSTGIYFVNFFTTHRQENGTSMYNGIQFQVTTDNSSYSSIAAAYDSVAQTAYFANTTLSHILDITNTSTHKIKFAHVAATSSKIDGDTNTTQTGATFIRLGDT